MALHQQFARIRGNLEQKPDLSVIIPFNAQADMQAIQPLLEDLSRYKGRRAVEVLVVLNNYPSEQPPPHKQELEAFNLAVVCVPNVRKKGEAVAFSGRVHGLRAASSDHAVLFDADCRVPNATALLDWYADQLQNGAVAAYTPVHYNNLPAGISIRARVLAHYLARWGKRALLRVPTTRGGNYAVNRVRMLPLYDQGYMADEMNVGPTMKAKAGRVAYSGARRLRVLTSGDRLRSGWSELGRYLMYRLRYNMNVLPVDANAAKRTKRTHSNGRAYAIFSEEQAQSTKPEQKV